MELIAIGGLPCQAVLHQMVADPVHQLLKLLAGIQAPVLLGHLRGGLQADRDFLFGGHVDVLYPSRIGIFLLVAATTDEGKGYDGKANEDSDPPTSSFHGKSA